MNCLVVLLPILARLSHLLLSESELVKFFRAQQPIMQIRAVNTSSSVPISKPIRRGSHGSHCRLRLGSRLSKSEAVRFFYCCSRRMRQRLGLWILIRRSPWAHEINVRDPSDLSRTLPCQVIKEMRGFFWTARVMCDYPTRSYSSKTAGGR